MTREDHVRQGVRLEYLTLAWNALEAVVAIASGVVAGSIALVGFGLDSVIEMSSGAALLWRLRRDSAEARQRAEKIALKLVGWSFLCLAIYVSLDAAKTLYVREKPDESIPGTVIATASLIVMPLLARAKRRVAVGLSSGAMRADSRQTDICAYLSAILLVGLALNAWCGWWWADPVAALLMVPIIVAEAVRALRGEQCNCQTASAGVRGSPCETLQTGRVERCQE
jgi:divalent metal cation (Fe/Co/Zn/Cd) transporter